MVFCMSLLKIKNTGKEQSITVKASSGLSNEEVEKMIKDAQTHAEEDKKFQELASARNAADAIIHTSKNAMTELGSKLSDDEKAPIESAIEELEETMKNNDKVAIEAKTNALSEKAQVLMQKAQTQTQSTQSAQTDDTKSKGDENDDVVEADFEEVKENKKG